MVMHAGSHPAHLDISPDRRIAYHKTHATDAGVSLPQVMFLGGFMSDMTGTKAVALEEWANRTGRGFVRFDYRGHGQSSGVFADGCISDWADDAGEALMQLTSGKTILVGSSMGGWISLLLAKRMPERIAALVGIAAAPDFTLSMRAGMDAAAQAEMAATGRWARPSEYSDDPYVITQRLLDDGDANLVLTAPLRVAHPVHLLQGTLDEDVPVAVAQRLFDHVEGPDTRLTLVKGADHRFSGAREIALLIRTVEAIA